MKLSPLRLLPLLAVLCFASLVHTTAARSQEAVKPSFDPATGTITDARWESGVPLGGIGVGKVELLTDGGFGNFTHQHNWDRPYGWVKGAFAAVRARYLRITNGGSVPGRFWSVHELPVYPAP